MIVKTLSGLSILDEPYGGVFSGRSVLVCGRGGSGKTTAGFHFVRQGIAQDERCLILSTIPADDLTILAESLGFGFALPIDRGDLILLEYQSFVPGRAQDWKTVPVEGFNQLREIIETNSISRLVIDTVLPWVAVTNAERIAEQVFSFVRSFDRLGVTTLMTIPKPVNTMAFKLKKALENVIPISVLLTVGPEIDEYSWQVVKYLGEHKSSAAEAYHFAPKKGIVPGKAPTESTYPETQKREEQSRPSGSSVRFSTRIPATKDTDEQPKKSTETDIPNEKPGTTRPRLASVWKPDTDRPAS